MANYFSKFPITYYNLTDSNNFKLVTNIISRYVIEQNIRENMVFYDVYDIRDGDTPENLAYKFYSSPERHWLILAANGILDVETQWPLTNREFNIYLNAKYSEYGDGSNYGGLNWAKSNYKVYYRVEKITAPNGIETIKKFEVDSNTYLELANTTSSVVLMVPDGDRANVNAAITIANTVEQKTYYEYEYEENESKRQIKILRFQYVDLVEKELERVFSE